MADGTLTNPHPIANLTLAFTPGRRFERDGYQYEMEISQTAELCLPTGRIVAADPGHLDDRVEAYFSRTVRPGKYPVELALIRSTARGKKIPSTEIACMRICFSHSAVVRWGMANTAEQILADLPPSKIYGYGVDAGMGSFSDSSALVALLQQYRHQGKTLYEEFYSERVLPAYEAASGMCAQIELDPATGANLILCTSGYGDGYYASYWGLAEDGEPACLATDFGLLTRRVNSTRELGTVSDLAEQTIRLSLAKGDVTLQLLQPTDRMLMLDIAGEGGDSIEIEYTHEGRKLQTAKFNMSRRRDGRTIEQGFVKPIPSNAIVSVTYFDHIEGV